MISRENILLIFNFLNDKDKIHFLMTCKKYYYFYIDEIEFNDIYDYNKIKKITLFILFQKHIVYFQQK